MSAVQQRISPCLWFDDQAEDAAELYVSLFPNSKLGAVTRYGEAGRELHNQQPGSVMSVEFSLDGQAFMALNGGPLFQFSEAISLQVFCDTQAEIDHYWNGLSAGGDPNAQNCGWLKDKFGLSWQVVPRILGEILKGPDAAKAQRMMSALMEMKKLDIARLQAAANGS